MTAEFISLFAIGFFAQLIDGALGMAYGVLSNVAILAIGVPPAQASALVHTAEIFTTGASAASHIYHRNVDWRYVMRLGVPGVAGAVLGAWILSNVDVAAARRYVYVVGSGHAPRQTVGSVNTAEFAVTLASATTFFVELGASPWQHLAPLLLGGLLAAPVGGWAVKRISARALMTAVGLLIVLLSLFQLGRATKLF